jgi:hypothetical protein
LSASRELDEENAEETGEAAAEECFDIDDLSPEADSSEAEELTDEPDVPVEVSVANNATRMANKLLSVAKADDPDPTLVSRTANRTVSSLAALEQLLRTTRGNSKEVQNAAEDLRRTGMRFVNAAKMLCVARRDTHGYRYDAIRVTHVLSVHSIRSPRLQRAREAQVGPQARHFHGLLAPYRQR